MLVIQLSFIAGQHPLEVASATLDDVTYRESSRSSCVAKLARALVAAGIPDQSWHAVSPNGTVALRGRSLHGVAKTTITESDRVDWSAGHGIRTPAVASPAAWRPWLLAVRGRG